MGVSAAARPLGAVHDIEEGAKLGHVAQALPRITAARKTVFAPHTALDDPLVQRGQVAQAQRAASDRSR
jgi:hypothetical protein